VSVADGLSFDQHLAEQRPMIFAGREQADVGLLQPAVHDLDRFLDQPCSMVSAARWASAALRSQTDSILAAVIFPLARPTGDIRHNRT
jgi:hypothetical protein